MSVAHGKPQAIRWTGVPFLSVIVPVFDSPQTVEACLISIRKSSFEDYEILVVDDGSPDGPAIRQAAERHGAKALRLEANCGPARARNLAAKASTGEILFFVDADESVHHDTLERAAEAFRADPTLDALMGSYDFEPKVSGMVATFRNLLHAHVHHRSSYEAQTFWAGCGGVRRHRFIELGCFDESYRQLEDVEFGIRLHRSGGRLALDPRIQVKHHKEWTLTSMLYTDATCRAMPWTELLFRHGGLPSDLNFGWRDRVAAMAAMLLPILLWLSFRFGHAWWGMALAALAVILLVQMPLFRFLARVRGLWFSVASSPLYLAHLYAAAVGSLMGIYRWESRDRWFPRAVVVLALLIFAGVQFAGGAYTAEFDGHPDEAAHFMTALLIRDFLAQWPSGNPMSWAEQYYLHYPKVAFGHWPPLFHVAEAAWWLFLPPSRVTGMLLIGLIGLAVAVAFYRMARAIVSPPAALFSACLLVATPPFQTALAQFMADLPTLLCEMLLLGCLARLVRGSASSAAVVAGLACGACLFVKGTGVCLLAAPFLALLLSGQWRSVWRRSVALPVGAVIAGAAVWQWLAGGSMAASAGWAGLAWPSAANLKPIFALAGYGLPVLAAAGFVTLAWKREPLAVAAAAVALSVAGTGLSLGAMKEPRHWLLEWPPMLLLSLVFWRRLCGIPGREMSILAAGTAAAGALILFPWSRYHQQPLGYAQLADCIRQPARMLVSGARGAEEGSWIVLASLREPRPSSVIVRATKVLARMGWNGEDYHLLAATPVDVAATLDRLGIETVILDDHLAVAGTLPHELLLRQTLETNSTWRKCASARSLAVYCRMRPPLLSREPVRVDLRRRIGRVISEK